MLDKLVLASAVLGTLAIALLTILGGASFPGYSHASQFISELGATGAPHARLVNLAGFLPAGILICSFAVLAWKALPGSVGATLGLLGIALFGFGYLVAAYFPCDVGCRPSEPSFSQFMHNALGMLGYLTAPLALALLGWQARAWQGGQLLSVLGFACAVAAFAGLALLSPEFAYVGVAQRVLEASVLSWTVACGIYLVTRTPRSQSVAR
jgi:hypothetical membrane protein